MERKGYRKCGRRGSTVYVIDFRYLDMQGVWSRYRRDAEIQTVAGAKAEAYRRRLLAMQTGSPFGVAKEASSTIPTLDAFWTDTFSTTYLVTDYTPATAERYRALYRQLAKDFGSRRLDEITLEDWKRFEAKLKQRKRRTRTGETVSVRARPFAAFMRTLYNAAVELKIVTREQVPAIPLPAKPEKLPDCPGKDELAAWLAVRPLSWIVVATALAIFLGARMGEVRELRRRDFDLDGGWVVIRRAISGDEVSTTKGKKERAVPLHPSLRAMLTPILASLKPDDLVVRNRTGRRPSRQAVLTAFKRLCARAGTRTWSFHALRHAFVTTLLRRGAPTIAVQHLVGHEKMETTERYAHAIDDGERRSTILLLPEVATSAGTTPALGNGEETAASSSAVQAEGTA